MDRNEARNGGGIEEVLRRATMRGVEPPDHHSFPRQTLLIRAALPGQQRSRCQYATRFFLPLHVGGRRERGRSLGCARTQTADYAQPSSRLLIRSWFRPAVRE